MLIFKGLFFWHRVGYMSNIIKTKNNMKKSTLKSFISYDIKKEKKESIISKFERMTKWSKECKGTNYYKVFILGNTGIYYAHPQYGHADYNKCRVCNITPYTKRLMRKFMKDLEVSNDVHYVTIQN